MRALKAFLIAPLMAPLVYWITSLASAMLDPVRRHAASQSFFTSFAIVMLIGGAVSYAATAVIGGPIYWFVARRNGLGLATAVSSGAVGGATIAALLGPSLHGDLVSIPLGPLRGAVMGASVAVVFWYFLRGLE